MCACIGGGGGGGGGGGVGGWGGGGWGGWGGGGGGGGKSMQPFSGWGALTIWLLSKLNKPDRRDAMKEREGEREKERRTDGETERERDGNEISQLFQQLLASSSHLFTHISLFI